MQRYEETTVDTPTSNIHLCVVNVKTSQTLARSENLKTIGSFGVGIIATATGINFQRTSQTSDVAARATSRAIKLPPRPRIVDHGFDRLGPVALIDQALDKHRSTFRHRNMLTEPC